MLCKQVKELITFFIPSSSGGDALPEVAYRLLLEKDHYVFTLIQRYSCLTLNFPWTVVFRRHH